MELTTSYRLILNLRIPPTC